MSNIVGKSVTNSFDIFINNRIYMVPRSGASDKCTVAGRLWRYGILTITRVKWSNQDILDRMILKIFPYFVVVVAALGLVIFSISWGSHSNLGHFMYSMAVAYIAGFIILGLPVIALSNGAVIRNCKVIPLLFLLATLLGLVLWFGFGPRVDGLNRFISGFYWFVNRSGLEYSLVTTLVGIYVLLIVCLLASYGIISVVVAYFRKYYARILHSLERNDSSRLCRSARKWFGVPDIIDVDNVSLESPECNEYFNRTLFVRIFAYEMIIGLVIASYIFLNPIFLQTIQYGEMMVLMMLLSLFVSVFVIPVSILHSLGAVANSEGNRPFYLWDGMKNRMFHPAFYITLFVTLLWVSLYSQMDSFRILTHYVGYLLFMGFLAALVTFIYLNAFYIPLKKGIVDRFDESESGRK